MRSNGGNPHVAAEPCIMYPDPCGRVTDTECLLVMRLGARCEEQQFIIATEAKDHCQKHLRAESIDSARKRKKQHALQINMQNILWFT